MNKEINVGKLLAQLEASRKRRNPYTFYDKDELIDKIIEIEDSEQELKERIDKLIEIFEKEIEKLKEKRRMIMTILTPENGYLKADVEFEIERLERYLEILKGDSNE